jgi:hypothetical protein
MRLPKNAVLCGTRIKAIETRADAVDRRHLAYRWSGVLRGAVVKSVPLSGIRCQIPVAGLAGQRDASPWIDQMAFGIVRPFGSG